MTKQEKIQEAYGEHWDFFKEKVNENGWIKDREFWGAWPEGGSKINWQTTDHDNDYYDTRRPFSLKGIEYNNGWIKIQSENDLPKEDCRCEFIKHTGTQFYGRFENRMGGLFVDESRRFEHPETRTESVTHWKLILTSVKPIY